MSDPHLAQEPDTSQASADPRAPRDRAHAERVARLFHEHNAMLVRLLATRLHSVSDAKEVAQEAYVRVLQLDKPGASNLLRAYLFRVALNLAIDRLRHRTVEDRVQSSEPDLVEAAEDLCDPERHVAAREELGLVASCMRELPEKCGKAFLMYRLEGETQEQIAKHLGVSDRMVNMYIRQAMLYCRLRLQGMPAAEAKSRLPR